MELPPRVQLDSQTIDDDGDRQENNNCTGNRQADYHSSHSFFTNWIVAELFVRNLHNIFAAQPSRGTTQETVDVYQAVLH